MYTLSNNENKKPENIQTQRPIQLTSSQQQNVGTNRKRRNQPARQTSAVKHYNEFSLSSGDEDDDESFNYNNFSKQLWRPNKSECVSKFYLLQLVLDKVI